MSQKNPKKPHAAKGVAYFASREDWYRGYLHGLRAAGLPVEDRGPKIFVMVFFMQGRDDPGSNLSIQNELVRASNFWEDCRAIRDFYLRDGKFFKWLPPLPKQKQAVC